MGRNLIFLLLATFLLGQCFQHAETASTDRSTEPKSSEEGQNFIGSAETAEQLTPRIRLLAHILRKTSPIFAPVMDSSEIFQTVLWKTKKMSQRSGTFTPLLSTYVEKITKLYKLDDKHQRAIQDNPQFIDTELGQQLTVEILEKFLDSTSDFADIVEHYKALDQQLDADLAIKEKLETGGFLQKVAYFDQVFARLQPRILLSLEKYFASLIAMDYAQESSMVNWYKQLKHGLPNVQTFVKFGDFFTAQEICTVAKYYKNK